MSRPVVPQIVERIYDALPDNLTWGDETTDWATLRLISLVGTDWQAMQDLLDFIADEQAVALADPDTMRFDYVAFASALLGVIDDELDEFDVPLTETQRRARVPNTDPERDVVWRHGTALAIAAAARRLTDTAAIPVPVVRQLDPDDTIVAVQFDRNTSTPIDTFAEVQSWCRTFKRLHQADTFAGIRELRVMSAAAKERPVGHELWWFHTDRPRALRRGHR